MEAAKTTRNLPAPTAGTLERIIVPEGATVPVQELLAAGLAHTTLLLLSPRSCRRETSRRSSVGTAARFGAEG